MIDQLDLLVRVEYLADTQVHLARYKKLPLPSRNQFPTRLPVSSSLDTRVANHYRILGLKPVHLQVPIHR